MDHTIYHSHAFVADQVAGNTVVTIERIDECVTENKKQNEI